MADEQPPAPIVRVDEIQDVERDFYVIPDMGVPLVPNIGIVGGRDAVLVATLPPGSYTAQVSGVGGTTGVALLEVYDVP